MKNAMTLKNVLVDVKNNGRKNVLTLYDLVEAFQEEVRPEDDELVANIIMCSLKTGKVRFTRDNVAI